MESCIRRSGFLLFALFLAVPTYGDIRLQSTPPPQVDALNARAMRGQTTKIMLRAHHHGSGTIWFHVEQSPRHGKVSDPRPIDDNQAEVIYQNDGTEAVGTDRFTYVVRADNQVSSPAEVRIQIEEPAPQLQVPARFDFDPILTGETEIRPLTITNNGGGLLSGHLTVSAPWRITAPTYRVRAGATETIELIFQPNESRDFVGQITLKDDGGRENIIPLGGRAIAPIVLEPSFLRIEKTARQNGPGSGFFSLTNRTEKPLRLKFETSSRIEPIGELFLGPKEKKRVELVLAANANVSISERISIVGPNFRETLPVEAIANPAVQVSSSEAPEQTTKPVEITGSQKPMPTSGGSSQPVELSTSPSVEIPTQPMVSVRARRLDSSRWELSWSTKTGLTARYRIDERELALDPSGQLQVSWKPLVTPEFVKMGDSTVAKLEPLDPKRLHVVKVVALDNRDLTIWESALISLLPQEGSSAGNHRWLFILALVLGALLFLRWRATRVAA